jgi:hypothetical protein
MAIIITFNIFYAFSVKSFFFMTVFLQHQITVEYLKLNYYKS